MKSKFYRVKANEGYRSERMGWVDAIAYAKTLEKLGNYNVKVVRASATKRPA